MGLPYYTGAGAGAAATSNTGEFDSGPIVLTGSLANVIRLKTRGLSRVLFRIAASGADLADVQVTQAATSGGPHDPVASGDDFATATTKIPTALTATNPVSTTKDGEASQIEVAVGGAAEIALRASGSGATVTVSGRVV